MNRTFICPSPLVNVDPKVDGYVLWVIEQENCAVPCPSLTYTHEEWDKYSRILLIVAITCIVVTLGVIGLSIRQSNISYPKLMFMVGAFVNAAIIMLFLLLNQNNAIVCNDESHFNRQDRLCIFQSAVTIFSLIWIESWSVFIAMDTYLNIVYNVTAEKKKILYRRYTVITIIVSIVFVLCPMLAGNLGFDEQGSYPICLFLYTQNSDYFWGTLFAPFVTLNFFCLLVTILCLYRLHRVFVLSKFVATKDRNNYGASSNQVRKAVLGAIEPEDYSNDNDDEGEEYTEQLEAGTYNRESLTLSAFDTNKPKLEQKQAQDVNQERFIRVRKGPSNVEGKDHDIMSTSSFHDDNNYMQGYRFCCEDVEGWHEEEWDFTSSLLSNFPYYKQNPSMQRRVDGVVVDTQRLSQMTDDEMHDVASTEIPVMKKVSPSHESSSTLTSGGGVDSNSSLSKSNTTTEYRSNSSVRGASTHVSNPLVGRSVSDTGRILSLASDGRAASVDLTSVTSVDLNPTGERPSTSTVAAEKSSKFTVLRMSYMAILRNILHYQGRSMLFLLTFCGTTIYMIHMTLKFGIYDYDENVEGSQAFVTCLLISSLFCRDRTQEGVDLCAETCGKHPTQRPPILQVCLEYPLGLSHPFLCLSIICTLHA